MKIYFSFSKAYSVVLCVFLLVAFSFLAVASCSQPKITLETEGERAAFHKTYGFNVGDPDYVKTFYVPAKGEIDEKLYGYKGCFLTEYFYSFDDYLKIRIITEGEELADAYCIDLCSGSIYSLEGG